MTIAGANLLAIASGGNLAEVTLSTPPAPTGDSPAELVASLLAGLGVGTSGTDLFLGFQPDTPDACVTCYDSGGRDPDPKWALDYPRVQVIVRSARGNYSGGWNKALAVKDALLGDDAAAVIRGITMMGDTIAMGTDESGRFEWSLNFQLFVQPATTGNRSSL